VAAFWFRGAVRGALRHRPRMATTTLRREQPLFETSLPVQYFAGNGGGNGGDSEVLQLTLRVIAGTRFLGGGQSQRLLHIEFTNPQDLGFLYTMQVRCVALRVCVCVFRAPCAPRAPRAQRIGS
jgi:hypothetical protein